METRIVAQGAVIHPTAIVERGAEIGAGAEIGPYCIVSGTARIGEGVRLIGHVQVMGRTTIGAGCEVWPFAVLGGMPQFADYTDADTDLIVGERNVIREHVTMHRGSTRGRGTTSIGADGLFMVGSHVAHDCRIGDHVIFANSAAVAGHCQIGDYAFLGGLVGVHQWTRIGKHAFVGGVVPVVADVIPYGMVSNAGVLDGLNVVGLRRRGFSREQIHDLRAAYRLLFAEEGTLAERLEDVATLFANSPEAQEIVEFIRADAQRPLCKPSRA
ncbi:MAG TPA: acyl-ACP--UDP-N-acetylglucosamine O-acyltransferase [Caulobacterales bacterium]|nr:acyl-ACP--UDP-N-acetylglucosamine O-acyltransferase [Caulobacterales bacterium]